MVLGIIIDLHKRALEGVFQATLAFFESNPTGRILQRFTGDLTTLEFSSYFVSELIELPPNLIACIFLVSQSSWISFAPLPIYIYICYRVYKLYSSAYVEISRINPIVDSGNISMFKELINGSVVFKAYGQVPFAIDNMETNLDTASFSLIMLHGVRVWESVRLGSLTAIVTFIVALSIVFSTPQGDVAPAQFALSLSYTPMLLQNLIYLFDSIATFESSMSPVERLIEYIDEIPKEKERVLPSDPSSDVWISKGKVEISNLTIAYPSQPDVPVLKSVSLTIKEGEKIGVVGRTGAGKSTLASCLFRIIDEYQGDVIIDGRNIKTMGLETLRKQLFIILQDPILFQGSLRTNLDPENEFKDEELWQVLEKCQLKEYVGSFEQKLDEPITENGIQFSLGQKQLLGIAVAMLKKPKIIVFDESTSAMDNDSDTIIQGIIEAHFQDATVISIAHRLNTVIQYDRILVLDQGNVVDFETPHILLQKQDSIFNQMALATGQANYEKLVLLANL
jgi:ABC-type multidrug transport system fused ATPase/permease subunit